MAETGFL